MMIQRKARVRKNAENGKAEVAKQRRSTAEVDHWAFLEEVEAPMWADLTLESKLMNEDVDDHWFNTTHKFHQCSARQLRSEFSHSCETSVFFDFNVTGVSSPKLPSSVSKSRGKKHKTMKWGEHLSPYKGHPVKNLHSRTSSSGRGASEDGKTKICFGNTRKTFGSQSTLTSDNGFSGKDSNSPGLLPREGGTKGGFNSVLVSTKESYLTGNMTSESNQQQEPKALDSSKQAFSQSQGLLSTLRMNIRKSHATRPALRVAINEGRGSNGCKASSGNSSVGSSTYPGFGAKNTTLVINGNENRTPESRNLVNKKQAANQQLQVSIVAKGSTIQSRKFDGNKSKWQGKTSGGKVEHGSRNPVNGKQATTQKPQLSIVAKASTIQSQNVDGMKSKLGGKSTSGNLEFVKPRVPLHTLQKKVADQTQVHVKGQSVLTKAKGKLASSSITAMKGPGTENTTGMVVSKKSDFKENLVAGIRGRKTKQSNIGHKGEGTLFVGSKGKMIGRNDGRHVLKNQMVQFR